MPSVSLSDNRFDIDCQIAARNRVRDPCRRIEIFRHRVQRLDEVTDLVVAGNVDLVAEITDCNRIGQAHGTAETPADIERNPCCGADTDQQRYGDNSDQQHLRLRAILLGLRRRISHRLS